ncbi:trace amine-associated receptor 7a-like [Mastacembelus armatus]|uniref:trace amine-associated receptor 7a-like n=1 Tax=Mastacembelus armatus TaxID=205130 RepID=UPI001436AEDF|nr:trace amine-associated receptor 7a-like [Mastacembelus armatus]
MSLLTASLNLLVIISISHFRQLHTPTNLLLLSLAVSDFLVGLFVTPFHILLIEPCWFLGDLVCVLYYFLSFITVYASVLNMVLISVDRYVAICDPLHYPTRITLNRVQICVVLFWVYSVFYSFMLLHDNLIQPGRYNSCYGECVINVVGAVGIVLVFIIPVSTIIILYVRVFVVAVSQVFSSFLIFLNSCLNPVIYAFLYPWFRKSVKLIVTLEILQPNSCMINVL